MRSHIDVSDYIQHSVRELQKLHGKEYYRFIVPGCLHAKPGEHGWQGFEARHPNALPAALEALGFAFTDLNNLQLSPELIQGIHQFCTTNVETHTQIRLGNLRKGNNGFYLAKELDFVSIEGFKEFYEMVHHLNARGVGTAFKVVRPNYINHFISRSKANSRLQRIKHCDNFKNLVDAFERGNYVLYRAPAAPHLMKLLESVCESYNHAIQCQDKMKKLRIIAEHVQLIERLHLFPDGNGRTSLILLQRLLLQNGFLPSMLFNPDCIDGYSLNELISEIKKGCSATKKLINVPDYCLYGYQTQIDGHALPDANQQSDEDFFKNLRMRGVRVATLNLVDFIKGLSTNELNELEIQQKPKYNVGRFLALSPMNFWQVRQIQAFQHSDTRALLKMLRSLNEITFDLNLLNTFLMYYQACVSEYRAAVRSTPSLELKKKFLSKLMVVLPYLDLENRRILLMALSEQETGKLRFLNAHRQNRFYTSYIETNSWQQAKSMLPKATLIKK